MTFSGVAMAALPHGGETASPEEHQWQALGIAPLSAGGRTGLRLVSTDAVEPIDVAPDRPRVELAMTLGASDSIHALLVRAGASHGDAAQAGAMIAAASPPLAAGTKVSLVLGERAGPRRQVDRVALRAGLATNLEVVRGAGGALQLIRHRIAIDTRPLRIRGRVGDGLYWSLRSAGASPQSAAEYLQALASEIDVGSDVSPDDKFDLVVASRRAATGERQIGTLLYAGIDRAAARDLQLLRWRSGDRLSWVDATDPGQPSQAAGMALPVAGRITSGFGYRIHPILRFARLHKGVDFGAGWGTPITAAADGQVTAAGWAGGYGRQVRLAHGGGVASSYSHMSRMVVEPGSFVRQGQLIGYVGSSGLSTGPHLHYEVYRGGVAVNPLNVRFAGAVVDSRRAEAIKARLKALLG